MIASTAQVRLGRRRSAERYSDVDRIDMQRIAVGLGVDADRRDTHLVGGAGDPAGDLSAVRDQQPHQCLQIPYSRVPRTVLLCAADRAMPST